MNPKEGARKQIEIYKRMTGSERLRIVFELWEMALAQIKASEKALHPDLNEEEIAKRSRKRMRVGTISCN
jgi:ABC-type Na+ transport system ATPase subunit NatA